jgi:hypothetical protein
VTSTVQSTQLLTSILTTTVTSYTATTTFTSTSVVYTTVTANPGGAGAGASSPLTYLGFISLLAVMVGRRVTGGKGYRIRHLTCHHGLLASSPRSLSPYLVDRRDTILSRLKSLVDRRCSSS